MGEQAGNKRKGELAALFVLAVLTVLVVVALGWGRCPWPAPNARRGAAPPAWPPAFEPLQPHEQSYLVRLLFDTMAALKSEQPVPEAPDAPAGCRQEGFPVFVTLYAAGRGSLSAKAQSGSLAEDTKAAARHLMENPACLARGLDRTTEARVRFDVVTERRHLPPAEREQFALLEVAAPFGVALEHGEAQSVFLPSDAAGLDAGDHLGMLRSLDEKAGLFPGSWRRKECRVSLLRGWGFVNAAPGGTDCLPTVRGLPLVTGVDLAQVERGAALAAQYMVRFQHDDGRFPASHSAAGEPSGVGALNEQAAAAAALAACCARQGGADEQCLRGCRLAIRYLVKQARVPPARPHVAFMAPDEGMDASLLDAAAALRAFCVYGTGFEDDTWDDLIRRLGGFVLMLQGESGSFASGYDAQADRVIAAEESPASASAQAEAAAALALAYGRTRDPRFLLAAQKAIDRLAADEQALRSCRAAARFVSGVRELSKSLPMRSYLPAVRRAVAAAGTAQLSAEEAPAPDLVGGSLRARPPTIADTACDMETLAAGCLVEGSAPAAEESKAAALGAARYVLQFQFVPENSYYLLRPEAARGGFRFKPGSNVMTLRATTAALDGLNLLAHVLTLKERMNYDSQGAP